MGLDVGKNPQASLRHALWIGALEDGTREGLNRAGWSLTELASRDPDEAELARNRARVGVIDMRGNDGRDLRDLETLLMARPERRWIALVGPHDLSDQRVSALVDAGCCDYVTTPFEFEHIRVALGRAWGMAGLQAAGQGETIDVSLPDMLGESAPMRELRTRISQFAPIEVPVLITGETGTGKEVAARALHLRSTRREQPFVAINCGALPMNLVQSELFGHERGAFTGASTRKIGRIETAESGTVFLDEIGDLPLDAQTNLLRFLQEGTIERVGGSMSLRLDVRVIAATHVDLEKAVAQGHFREDLYYRLNVLRLPVPPLRERGHDILLLARHFLATFRRQHAAGTRVRDFGPRAEAALAAFAWPGNVRELMNRVRRAAVVAEGPLICADDLDLPEGTDGVPHTPASSSLDLARAQAEREAIMACLRASRFNVSECARRLQVSRVTVYRLCKKYNVTLSNAPPN